MLGLITHISEMVQEIPRKYSVKAKCGILRSLGALVRHIGPAITNIAPQVCLVYVPVVLITLKSILFSVHGYVSNNGEHSRAIGSGSRELACVLNHARSQRGRTSHWTHQRSFCFLVAFPFLTCTDMGSKIPGVYRYGSW